MKVVEGDGCHGAAHAGGQGFAGVAHEVRDAEKTSQGLGVLRHFEVPVGGGRGGEGLPSGLAHPKLLPPRSRPLP